MFGLSAEKLTVCRGDRKALSMVDSTLLALEDRIRITDQHAPIIRTNFCKVDSKAFLNVSAFSREKVLGKETRFLAIRWNLSRA